MQLCVVVNKMKRTPSGVEVGYPTEDDAVQEQGGSVDLHRATQKTVEDPNIPGITRSHLKCIQQILLKNTAEPFIIHPQLIQCVSQCVNMCL